MRPYEEAEIIRVRVLSQPRANSRMAVSGVGSVMKVVEESVSWQALHFILCI